MPLGNAITEGDRRVPLVVPASSGISAGAVGVVLLSRSEGASELDRGAGPAQHRVGADSGVPEVSPPSDESVAPGRAAASMRARTSWLAVAGHRMVLSARRNGALPTALRSIHSMSAESDASSAP